MNKLKLINEIKQKLPEVYNSNIPARIVELIIDSTFAKILDELKSENMTKVGNLGTFKIKYVKESEGEMKSPIANGKKFKKGGYNKIYYKMSKFAKDFLNK